MRVYRKGKPDARMLLIYCLFAALFIGISVYRIVGYESKNDKKIQSVKETSISQDSASPSDTIETALPSGTLENGEADPTSNSEITEDAPKPTATITPKPTKPAEEPVEEEKYTFDLSDDELLFETENRLSFFSSYEEIVILGGPAGLYRLDAGNVAMDGDIYSEKVLQAYLYSLNRDRIVFLSDYTDGETYDPSFAGHGTLMYYDGAEAVKISENVCVFDFSDDGTGIAYLKFSDTPNEGSELYVYNTETKKTVLISSFASDGFVFSPDGDTIAYREFTNPGDSTELCCYYQVIGAEPVTVKTGVTPVGLTNNGNIIYYITASVFTVQSGNRTQSLCSTKSFMEGIVFNRDHSQVLFPTITGMRFSKDGGKPIDFSAGYPLILEREGFNTFQCNYYDDIYYRFAFRYQDSIPLCTVNKKNLCNLLLQGANDLFYFDENLQQKKLTPDYVRYGHYVGTGLGVLCQDYDPENETTINYYLSDFMDPNCIPLIIGDEYARRIEIASSGAIYYDNDIGQIFRIDPDGSKILIDTYSSLEGCADYSGKSYVYYSSVLIGGRGIGEGALFCREDSGEPTTKHTLVNSSYYICVYDTDTGIVFQNNYRNVDDEDCSDSLYDLNRSVDGIHFSVFITMISIDYC